MTQRKKSQSIVLLMIVVLSAVFLWALAAVAWPVPVVYAADPEIITITVTSSLETYFYDPGLIDEGGTVYFNSLAGEGAGQVLTVTVTCSGTVNTFEGDPAFGDNPLPDGAEPWEITYTVGMDAGTQSGIVFTVTNGTSQDTAVITFTQDNVDPGPPTSPWARPDDYTGTGEYDDDTQIYFTWAAASDASGSGIATYYAEIGDSTPDEDAGMDFKDIYTGTEGLNAYYVAAFDNVGNMGSAVSDTITIDTTPPSITGITVTSDSPTFFHDPGLGVTGGEVFFNSLAGEGGGQTIVVTVSFDDDNPYRLEGDTVFGDSPVPDTSGPPWTLSYSIGTGAISETNRVFTVTDWAGNTDTAAINFTQDNTDPTVEFDDVTNPDYDSAGNELDDDGSNWYDPDNLSAGWYFTYTATDTSSDLALANASWDHSNDIYDQPINDPGLDGDGVFSGVDDDGDGMVTVTLTITDNVGNSASDTVVFNLDNTEPMITDPQIDETSGYLHADGLTVYYGDDMPGSRAFTVQGGAQDDVGGVGLDYVAYAAALNQGPYEDHSTPVSPWDRDYTANQSNDTSGVITVTVYDRVGNFATQFFTYTRDIINPTLSGPFTIVENSDYLYATGTTVYYSDRMGGTPQSFTVQGNASDSGGAGLYQATFSSALGSSPGYDDTPAEWSGTYDDVESSDSGPGTITVRVYDNVSNSSTQTFNYIEDTTNPTVDLTNVTNPGYDFMGDELDDDGSNWYNAGDFTGGDWAFTSDTGDGSGAGLDPDSGGAVWDHSANQSDRTLDCGSDGDGTFSSVSGDGEGTVTVTVVITDRVGNPASDSVVFNIDNTGPTITSPSIYCASPHLYVEGLTVYYGDDVVGLEGFRVQGEAQDTGGVGLDYVSYSAALGESYHEDHSTPVSPWSRDYTVEPGDDESGVITATVYDFLGNFATQTFTYIHDADGPTSVASSPQYDNASPIVVTYVNATDTGGSGLKWTELWYKKDSGSWADSGLSPQTGPSGSFNFIPTEGDGTYYFASVATDKAGNQETTPTGSGDTETIYDTTKPSVPGNFAYQNDSDSGGDGIAPLPGYYDDTEIQLRWTASTDGGSGLLPTNPYHLGTAPQPTGGSYAEDSPYDVGSSGTHSIYLTAEDNAGNISNDAVTGPVVVDTGLPQVENINCPKGTAEFSFVVGWSATDQGPAGLRSTDPYAVSYQVDGGGWRNWITATSAVTATFGPDSPVAVDFDHTYCFRMRAVDKAGNVQYTDGNDCTEVSELYGPDVKKIFLPIVMIPAPNWGFETGDFASWQHGGELVQSVSTAERHSGRYSALLGSPNYACNGVPVGSAWLRRWVEVPSSGSPTLSFSYRIFTQDKTSSQYLGASALNEVPSGDRFAVYINGSQVFADANTNTTETCDTIFDLGWKDGSIPLNDYMGTTIEITFYNYNWPDNWYNTYTYLDDVSVQ